MLCQMHATVLSFITKWYITVVYKSNYSVELAAVLHKSKQHFLFTKKYTRSLLLITTLAKLITLHLLTSRVGSPTSTDGCGGSTTANNYISCYSNISPRQEQLHKLGKTSTNKRKSPVQVTYGEMSFCCVNQASGSALGFSADWLRSPTAL